MPLPMRVAERPSVAQVWAWLAEVPDPELPFVSIVDLGIVREIRFDTDGAGTATCRVALTPTYSGCPATEVIAADVRAALHARGLARVEIETRRAPAWSTDWLSDEARRKLREHGIAPPGATAGPQVVRLLRSGRGAGTGEPGTPACPLCGSAQVERLSAFGSTPCKALYRCLACREPFDHFKPH